MLLSALSMVGVLNALDAGLLTAPEADHALTSTGEIHHVLDPDGVLGAPSHEALTLRVALGRVAHAQLGAGWALLTPRAGRIGALRGPKGLVRRLSAEHASVAVHHRTGVLWEPLVLPADGGRAVQWRLWQASRPVLTQMPDEAARDLSSTLIDVAERLDELGLAGGSPAERVWTVRLGRAYPPSSQVLVDRALAMLQQVEPAREGSADVLHSHGTLTREQALLRVERAALDAIEAAASWPSHLMV